MKNTLDEKAGMFREQVGWIGRKSPELVSREELEWLPWAQARLAELLVPCPVASAFPTGMSRGLNHEPARDL